MKDRVKKNVHEVVNRTAEGIERATATLADLNKQGTEVVRDVITKSHELGSAVTRPIQEAVVSTAQQLKVPAQVVSTPIEVVNKVREVALDGAMKTLDAVNTAIDMGARQVESVTQIAKAATKVEE